MVNDADLLADRRRLRRKLTVWRLLAFLAAIGIVGAVAFSTRGTQALATRPHVAKVNISGVIAGDDKTLDLLKRVGESRAAAAVLVMVDSPGGTTAGAEVVYSALRRLSEKKPTVAVVGTIAASGGYIAAIATDRVVSRQTSLVGSIGVLVQYPNFVRLLETIGVKVEDVKSSPLKAAPSGYQETPPEARAALAAIVADTYMWFKQLVRERRHFDDSQLAAVSDGRVFTGRQAVEMKLVDQLGDERDAVAWLEREKGITKDLPVREWKPRSGTGYNLWSSLAVVATVLGFDDLAHSLSRASLGFETARLDGLLAIWHPALEK